MDTDQALLQTRPVTCDMSGSSHVLVVINDPAVLAPHRLGNHELPASVTTVDGVPVETLVDPHGCTYYHDPQTGKTYREAFQGEAL